MRVFNEDTRVKLPATLQFLRIGYEYQSLKDSDIDFNTKIFVNRFKPAIEKLNDREFETNEIIALLAEIHTLMRNNDLGRSLYKRLTDMTADVVLIDFDNFDKNDFAVVDELPFTIERDTEEGSFRPDVNILINGMPLAFLEVKKPNNPGGIQEEFNRMINKRLQNNEYRKFFNLLQVVSFSNNMDYENNDNDDVDAVKAGSFYTTPNGNKTSFSFFREDEKDYHQNYDYKELDDDFCCDVIKDLGYEPSIYTTDEFIENNTIDTPCNRFITSFFDKERFLYILKNGLLYLKANNDNPPEKHIMRYPQFFATRNLVKRLDSNEKRGIIWHTQGSGKTELAAYCNGILKDYYAKKDTLTRFFFVVDRLELLRQDNGEFSNRYFSTVNAQNKAEFSKELNKTLKKNSDDDTIGEFVIVNIQKFEEAIPKAQNAYDANIQRVFFIDEAHRSYALKGTYFKNLILCDPNAIFVALTGTPLLSKKERSNLKFGDYIHKYFYDKSIADGYTLRIKKEKIDTVVKTEIKNNLEMEDPDINSADVYESDPYVDYLGKWIDKDFNNFRIVNSDRTIGGMIVCRSNPQAKKLHQWFIDNSKLSTGLVISDEGNPLQSEANANNQKQFKYEGKPDLLIVEYMLTTGYDVSRLKKMYLLRGPHAQNLLQTISRVNRPYKSPNGKVYHYGYITDFIDIEEEYDRTLEDYLKELEEDIKTGDEDDNTSLAGLVVDVNTIKKKYESYLEELNFLNPEDNLEAFSKRLTLYNKQVLLKIKHQLREINRNRNKDDIKMVNLDAALQELFGRMNIMSIDDLSELTDEMRKILEQAMAINAENERLANIYDGNYALVKTYQDIVTDRPELSNKDIEEVVKYIYSEIKEGIDTNILIVQGREGFIDETKKKVVKGLLKAGLYKKLNLKDWIQSLLSDMYFNLQNFR